ncbi:hypothetical protein Nepgr_014958 [Nepenthes gracilis]|uniref:Uncharacterized protein n=1 Tax=Nepenthes gracilis TaxID=150966 RepID=A0AAD3SL67_NEPGR|nr:hypothetical protein Nepgr_014958 [Nepenthes gracilis]
MAPWNYICCLGYNQVSRWRFEGSVLSIGDGRTLSGLLCQWNLKFYILLFLGVAAFISISYQCSTVLNLLCNRLTLASINVF